VKKKEHVVGVVTKGLFEAYRRGKKPGIPCVEEKMMLVRNCGDGGDEKKGTSHCGPLRGRTGTRMKTEEKPPTIAESLPEKKNRHHRRPLGGEAVGFQKGRGPTCPNPTNKNKEMALSPKSRGGGDNQTGGKKRQNLFWRFVHWADSTQTKKSAHQMLKPIKQTSNDPQNLKVMFCHILYDWAEKL